MTNGRNSSASQVADIKAIAFNVENNNRRFEDVVRFIETENPDLAVFSESVGEWPAHLVRLKSRYPHHQRLDELTMDFFSRFPIRKTTHHAYGPQRGFCVIEVEVQGRPLHLVAAHACPRHWYGEEGFRQRSSMLKEGLGRKLVGIDEPLVVLGDLNASPWSPDFKQMMASSGLSDARKGRGLIQTRHGHGLFSGLLW
jgi:endonuclease/exonuclease/phosphatase (EEP) superfamily protein YafD